MGRADPLCRALEESYSHGSRIPPSLVGLGEKEGGERVEGKGALPPPSPIRTRGRGGARPTLAAPLSFHQGPCGPLSLPGGFR